jgi:hypothetical protein
MSSLLYCATALLALRLPNNTTMNLLQVTVTTCVIALQKHYPESLTLPRLLYAWLLVSLAVQLHQSERGKHQQLVLRLLLPLCLILHSPTNIICLGLLLALLEILRLFIHRQHSAPLTTVLVAKAAFFYLGNSNGLATINVAAGYTGIGTYWPAIVTSLLAIHTFTGPLLVYAHYAAYDGYRFSGLADRIAPSAVLAEVYFYVAGGQALLMSVLCTALRFHLFVWTVFSPKLLYIGMELIVTTTFLVVYALIEK